MDIKVTLTADKKLIEAIERFAEALKTPVTTVRLAESASTAPQFTPTPTSQPQPESTIASITPVAPQPEPTPVPIVPVAPRPELVAMPAAPIAPPVSAAAAPAKVLAYTQTQIMTAASKLAQRDGIAAFKSILDTFGVPALTQLPPERYPELAQALAVYGIEV